MKLRGQIDNYEFCARFAAALCQSPAGRVLDYGCGAARIVRLLRERRYDAFGCDVFSAGGSYRDQVDPEYFAKGIVREMADGTIPFASASFDVVLSNQVLEHLSNLEDALLEMRRVLKPGGVMLALFPDKHVWREGHCGIPFLHWFPRGSRPRVWYAAALRTAGFGLHKGEKGRIEWSRDFCLWLDEWTHYRSYEETRHLFDRHFVEFRHHEDYWLEERLGRPWLVTALLPPPLKRLAVRKLVGVVVTCRKPMGDSTDH